MIGFVFAQPTLHRDASRVPDHGKLAPWRFIIFEGDARARASEVIAGVFAQKNPNASPSLPKQGLRGKRGSCYRRRK